MSDFQVWCLPDVGMSFARVTLRDEKDGTLSTRSMGLHELTEARDAILEGIKRVATALCEEIGHMPLESLDGQCARCGIHIHG